MEKQEFKSKWDELARNLGAEVSPEIEKREETVSLASQEIASAALEHPRENTAPPPPPLPKRLAPGWDSLASDLGLPPSEPVALAPVEVPREESRPERRPVPRQRETPQARRPERPERPERERSDRERKPRREQSDQRRDHREPVARTTQEEESRSVPPEGPREQPQKPAAVSLWHKIFGSPAEQTAKIVDEESRTEAGVASDLRDEPRAAGSGFADAHADESPQMQEDVDQFIRQVEESDSPDEGAPSDHRRARTRRRRGGRGRGRKSEDRRPDSRSTGHRDAEQVSRAPRRETDDESDDESDDDRLLDDDDADDSFEDDVSDAEEENGVPVSAGAARGSSALQRTIPSWDEAIGFIVDTNMQSRAQRRPPSRPGSRENGGRGRSRGRRNK